LKAVIGIGGDGFEDFDGLCHDFWTDAITGEDCD
jgi:predicted acetyltransferase